ncbi:MAG: NAD(P)H-hydrate dehydratase, partial [Anaerolineales bacterium]
MQRYLSVAKMIEVETASDQSGHTYHRMMAFAGRSVAEEILIAHRQNNLKNSVLGLIGSGNNGGDALVAMNHLLTLGWTCRAYFTADRVNDPLAVEFASKGGYVSSIKDDPGFHNLERLVAQEGLLLDGILGTGIKLPLRSPVSEVLRAVQSAIAESDNAVFVVAVDCPSGVDCDSGQAAEESLPADLTVCLAAVKQGLLKLPAYSLLGELVVGEIGLDPDLQVWAEINRYMIDGESARSMLAARPLDGHKGTFGKVIVIGGSEPYPGAPVLAGKAAFRSGAGWVTVAIPAGLHPHLATNFIEATWMPLPHSGSGFSQESADAFLNHKSDSATLLIGPGLGLLKESQDFINILAGRIRNSLVIDADGLKLLSNIPEWWTLLPQNSILTPHPGEMSIMSGLGVDQIQSERVEIAEKYSKLWNQVVVLKGAFTVVSEPGGKTAILPIATPALGRAGTGDVLAGIIAGLRAQGMGSFDSACAGVWYHAQAGLLATEKLGSTAGVL